MAMPLGAGFLHWCSATAGIAWAADVNTTTLDVAVALDTLAPDDRQALDFRPIERLERCALVFIWSSITSWLSSTSVGSVYPTTVVLGGALNIKITYKKVALSTL